MSWTLPISWPTGTIVTESMLNEQVRDNLRYLKGMDGTVTLHDALAIGTANITVKGHEIVNLGGTVKTDRIVMTSGWDAGDYEIRARTFESDVPTGTAPLTVASTTKVSNLNVDQVDSCHDTDLVKQSLLTTQGDIIIRGSGTAERLAVGAVGKYLRSNGTVPLWDTQTMGQLRVEYRSAMISTGTAETHTPATGKSFAIISAYVHAAVPGGTARLFITWDDDSTISIDSTSDIAKDYRYPTEMRNISEGVHQYAKKVDFAGSADAGAGCTMTWAFAALEG